MELHGILEKSSRPRQGLWYVLSAAGNLPSARVGHTCTYITDDVNGKGKVYVIGGADPSGPFADTLILHLADHSWHTSDAVGFQARYEHAAFVSRARPNHIYVFGGARQTGNLNDLHVYDTLAGVWAPVSTTGTSPSPRTYHTGTAACTESDRFIVYSGGERGSEPVGDRQVHCLDMATHHWSTLTVLGAPPKPRHGHIVAAVGTRVFVHGGMAGATFYADLHMLDLEQGSWTAVRRGERKEWPSARAAHAAVVVGTDLYVFGGMNRNGALDDLYKLDTGTLKWTQLRFDGPPPACRLDLGACVATLRVPVVPSADSTIAAGQLAKDVLDRQFLCDSSAGSGRSQGGASAGSGRSQGGASAGSGQSPGGASAGSGRSQGGASAGSGRSQGGASAGSGRSHGGASAGSGRSQGGASAGSGQSQQNEDILPQNNSNSMSPTTISTETGPTGAPPTVDVEVLLVLGGMDTEGDMFDDCLLTLLTGDS